MNRTFDRRPAHSVHRRAFLGRAAQGVGAVALASLLDPSLPAAAGPPAAAAGLASRCTLPREGQAGHLADDGGRAVAPGDVRPQAGAGRDATASRCRRSFTKGSSSPSSRGRSSICFGPQLRFRKFGQNGTEICELFPHIGSVADDICIVRSMTTEAINHDPAHMFMNTGSQIAGRPSMGSWVTYGLGSEADDLPGFVVLTSRPARAAQTQPIAARQWTAGFLPEPVPGRAAPRARATRCSTSATPPA